MKLKIYSDLHTEFQRGSYPTFWLPEVHEDDNDTVLILAGDIDLGAWSVAYASELSDRFYEVILVLGNHDLWMENIHTFYTEAGRLINKPNVRILQNEAITIDGVEFLGTTLWTDINSKDPFSVWNAPKVMVPDFENIRFGPDNTRLTSSIWLQENDIARDFLKKTISPAKTQVVITHHAPSFSCATGNPHSGDSNDCYFYNGGMDDLVADAGYWIFGHTHHKFDQYLGDTRVISNPRGYQSRKFTQLVDGFEDNFTIEI